MGPSSSPASELPYSARTVTHSLSSTLLGNATSSSTRNITSNCVPAGIELTENGKSTEPSPVADVIIDTGVVLLGRGNVIKAAAGGSAEDQGDTLIPRWQTPSLDRARPTS